MLDHYLGAGDEKRTAELAAQLEQIHTERGNLAASERFADLRERFEQAARAKKSTAATKVQSAREFPALPDVQETSQTESIPAEVEELVESAEQASEKTPSHQSAVHELDLSEEWAALASDVDATRSETEGVPTAAAGPNSSAELPGKPAREFDVPATGVPGLDGMTEMRELLLSDGPGAGSKSPSKEDYVLELDTSQTANEVCPFLCLAPV